MRTFIVEITAVDMNITSLVQNLIIICSNIWCHWIN